VKVKWKKNQWPSLHDKRHEVAARRNSLRKVKTVKECERWLGVTGAPEQVGEGDFALERHGS
jgi:hypothetical protein